MVCSANKKLKWTSTKGAVIQWSQLQAQNGKGGWGVLKLPVQWPPNIALSRAGTVSTKSLCHAEKVHRSQRGLCHPGKDQIIDPLTFCQGQTKTASNPQPAHREHMPLSPCGQWPVHRRGHTAHHTTGRERRSSLVTVRRTDQAKCSPPPGHLLSTGRGGVWDPKVCVPKMA